MNEIDQAKSRPLTDVVKASTPVAMVMTMVDGVHTSRPVTCAHVSDHRISFLVANNAEWVETIAGRLTDVHVTIADEHHSSYVALNGTAMIVHDVEEQRALWSPEARVWFDGPEDPNLAVMYFDVSDGQYWDGPSVGLGKMIALAKAAITGDPDAIGTRGQVIGRSN